MLGLSLAPRVFNPDRATDSERLLLASLGGVKDLLRHVRALGVTYIELRSVASGDDAAFICGIAQTIWDAGLKLTVHGGLPADQNDDFTRSYSSLMPLLQRMGAYQTGLTITLHSYSAREGDARAFADQTARILRGWCASAAGLPVRFALEINRKKGRIDPSVTCDGVLSMLNDIPGEKAGICWDFGHYYYNMSRIDNTPDLLPPKAFLERVIHTHIHAVGPQGTHTPFVPGAQLPIERYVGALAQAGYDGIYHFEPSFDRFPQEDIVNALDLSLRTIADAAGKAGAAQ